MITIEEVRSCPVTKTSRGIITLKPSHVAMIAGAVRDSIEWIVLFNGERSEDGYEVIINEILVPEQSRGSAHAEIDAVDVPENIIGVMHSHHRMGAYFSTIDTTTLNPRFPTSIVVAVAENNLGFEYEATGKVILPCGAVGMIDFSLSIAGIDAFTETPVRGQHSEEEIVDDLLECPNWQAEDAGYQRLYRAECGLKEIGEKPLVFGTEGAEDLLSLIRQQTKNKSFPGFVPGFQKKGNYFNFFNNPKQRYGYNMGSLGRNLLGGCDFCSEHRLLRWQPVTRLWLCDSCKDAQLIEQNNDQNG